MGFDILAVLTGMLQPGIAGYALRLQRVFGSHRVGWWVFYSFMALTFLQVLHMLHASGSVVSIVDITICALLLGGMIHAERFCNSRVQLERTKQKLEIELQRAADQAQELSTANENLLTQLLRREQREAELRESEQQFRLVFIENPQPMWIFDLRSFRVLAINDAAVRQYGLSHADLGSRTAKDLFAPEDAAAFELACTRPSVSSEARLWRQRRSDSMRFRVEMKTVDLHFDGCPARLVVTANPPDFAAPA